MTMRNNKFDMINERVLPALNSLVPSILPQGRQRGHLWVALNPTRPDRTLGSFKTNLRTGQWIDHATGDKGGDVISLAAYVYGMTQGNAADYIAGIMGVAINDN